LDLEIPERELDSPGFSAWRSLQRDDCGQFARQPHTVNLSIFQQLREHAGFAWDARFHPGVLAGQQVSSARFDPVVLLHDSAGATLGIAKAKFTSSNVTSTLLICAVGQCGLEIDI